MRKKVSLGIVFVLFPLFMFNLIDFSRETDIWFIFSHGRYILSNGFPHIEMLTMHSDLKFVMQQSGFSIIMYLLYKYFGSIGIVAFIGIINIAILFFLYKLCMVLSSNNRYFSFLFSSVIDLFLVLLFIIPRPQIVSLLIFLILIYILEKYIRFNDKIILFLPLLSLILVNTHASMWLMFFVLCMPYVLELFIDHIRKKDKKIVKLIIIIFVSFLVGFINPYGYEAMFYSINSYGVDLINKFILEMSHVDIFSAERMVVYNSYFYILLFIIQLFIFIKSRKEYAIHEFLLFLGLSFMAFLNIRNISIFLICSFPFIIKSIKKMFSTEIPIKVFIVGLLIILMFFIYRGINGSYKLTYKKIDGALEYINNNYDKNIIMFNDFIDGPYLEYNHYRPYIDTRAEVFIKKMNKKKDIFAEYANVTTGKINYDKFIDEYNFKIFIVEEDSEIYKYLNNNSNYKNVYHDKYRYIYERK